MKPVGGPLLIAGVIAASVAFAQPAPSDPPTHVVRIDAIAVDNRGRLIDDLKPVDFELHEDSTLRTVDSAFSADSATCTRAASIRAGVPAM